MAIIRHVKCTYPNCIHTGELLTNNHCESVHGMSKKELERKHGKAELVRSDDNAAKRNISLQKKAPPLNPCYASGSSIAKVHREQHRAFDSKTDKSNPSYR
jgi:hypothetical protein